MSECVISEDLIVGCQAIVKEKRYSRHSFVTQFANLLPSKQQLGCWALQKYHQVYRQNVIFSMIHAKTQHEDVRQFMMKQLIAEETNICCGTDSHYNLMKRFALACGVPLSGFDVQTCSSEVAHYIETLLLFVNEQHFVVALALIYSIETQTGESISKLLALLRAHYNFSESELEWFVVHAEEDDSHADEGLILIKKYDEVLTPDQVHTALLCVDKLCDAWLLLHDYYATLIFKS